MENNSFEELIKNFPCAGQIKNVQRCAKATIISAGLSVPQYTYAANERLYTAEETNGQWSLHEETNLHSAVRDMAVLLGSSHIRQNDLLLTLTPSEAVCFLALVDCYSLAFLQAAAQVPITSAGTQDKIEDMLKKPRKGGVLEYLYAICKQIEPNAKNSLKSLVDKDVCRFDNGEYILDTQSASLAQALARPCAAVYLCAWANVKGSAVHIPSLAIQGGLHNILFITASLEQITIASVSADSLLELIENTLSCPDVDYEPEDEVAAAPAAKAAPRPAAAPAANAAPRPAAAPAANSATRPAPAPAANAAPRPAPAPAANAATRPAPAPAANAAPRPAAAPAANAAPRPAPAPAANAAPRPAPAPAVNAAPRPAPAAKAAPKPAAAPAAKAAPRPAPAPAANAAPRPRQTTEQKSVCPFCKNLVRAGAKFCNSCGKSLSKAFRSQTQGSWKCGCGKINTGKFCSRCG